MMSDLALDTFPEGLAGLGHPICIAFLIMQVYPSYDEAVTRPEGATYCKALCDQRIPGTGSNVWAALDMLKRAEYLGVETALKEAQVYWESSDTSTENKVKGTQQALSIRERFLEQFANWGVVTA